MSNVILALAVSDAQLYASGYTGVPTPGGIWKWDGTNWATLGMGVGGSYQPAVYAMAGPGSQLYAGGLFATAGGMDANYIAMWDGNTWTSLGSGMGGHTFPSRDIAHVYALSVSGNDLYVGGDFTTAGGKVSPYIARAYLPTLPGLSSGPSANQPRAITVSWPSSYSNDFTLDQSASLSPAAWLPNAAPITDDGTNKSVTLPATNSPQFFRLRRP